MEILKTELETYAKLRDTLVAQHEGKYALIHETALNGVWDTYEDALKAGYEKWGLKPFLVKKIQGMESVQFFTRDITPCQV